MVAFEDRADVAVFQAGIVLFLAPRNFFDSGQLFRLLIMSTGSGAAPQWLEFSRAIVGVMVFNLCFFLAVRNCLKIEYCCFV